MLSPSKLMAWSVASTAVSCSCVVGVEPLAESGDEESVVAEVGGDEDAVEAEVGGDEDADELGEAGAIAAAKADAAAAAAGP